MLTARSGHVRSHVGAVSSIVPLEPVSAESAGSLVSPVSAVGAAVSTACDDGAGFSPLIA